jgi:hypothetical protein
MCTVLLPPGDNPIAINKYIISYHISYHIKGCFLSCLTNKRPPVVPLALCRTPSLGNFNSRWRKREKDSLFRTSNKNSPVLQHMLKMLPLWPNALSTTAEDFECLELFSGKCWIFTADVVSEFFQRVRICFTHSTRSPFSNWLSQRAQSGRWCSFGKQEWFTKSHTVLVISSYLLFYLLYLLLI